MSHNWAAQLAKPFHIPNGNRHIPATVTARPDGATVTFCGSLYSLLRVNGSHATPVAPYSEPLSPDFKKASGSVYDRVIADVRDTSVTGTVSLATLRGAVGEPEPPFVSESKPCDTCNGVGETECYACEHTHECDDCDGTGTTESTEDVPYRFVEFAGQLFNSLYLAPLLALLPDGEIAVSLTKKKVGDYGPRNMLLTGADWVIVCAGCHFREYSDPVAVVPFSPNEVSSLA